MAQDTFPQKGLSPALKYESHSSFSTGPVMMLVEDYGNGHLGLSAGRVGCGRVEKDSVVKAFAKRRGSKQPSHPFSPPLQLPDSLFYDSPHPPRYISAF